MTGPLATDQRCQFSENGNHECKHCDKTFNGGAGHIEQPDQLKYTTGGPEAGSPSSIQIDDAWLEAEIRWAEWNGEAFQCLDADAAREMLAEIKRLQGAHEPVAATLAGVEARPSKELLYGATDKIGEIRATLEDMRLNGCTVGPPQPEAFILLDEIKRLRVIEKLYNQECAAADEVLPEETPAPVSNTMLNGAMQALRDDRYGAPANYVRVLTAAEAAAVLNEIERLDRLVEYWKGKHADSVSDVEYLRQKSTAPETFDEPTALRAAIRGLLEIEDARIGTGAFKPNDAARERIETARALLGGIEKTSARHCENCQHPLQPPSCTYCGHPQKPKAPQCYACEDAPGPFNDPCLACGKPSLKTDAERLAERLKDRVRNPIDLDEVGQPYLDESVPEKTGACQHDLQIRPNTVEVTAYGTAARCTVCKCLWTLATQKAGAVRAFQDRVFDWAVECFGLGDTIYKPLRTYRFLEEALELAQACGCSQNAAMQILEYVYSRPSGEVQQETGGTLVSLAVLCRAFGVDMDLCGETELARVLRNVETIRERHALKPKFGSAPENGRGEP